MTAQEKIQELAMAALRAAPPSAGTPKPVTFMPTTEKPKAAAPAAAIEPAAPLAVEPVPEQEAESFKDGDDAELRGMIDERDAKKKKSSKRQSLAVTLSLLAVLGGAGGWIAVSPSARSGIARMTPLFQESVRDVKTLGNIKGRFDQSLDKIATHGGIVDDATRTLGVDPATEPGGTGEEIDQAMMDMTGGEGRTLTERNRELQEKLGFVGKLAGKDRENP